MSLQTDTRSILTFSSGSHGLPDRTSVLLACKHTYALKYTSNRVSHNQGCHSILSALWMYGTYVVAFLSVI